MDIQVAIEKFLEGSPHAVVGASTDREKYGNKVLRNYLQKNMPVFAVNPNATQVEGNDAFPDLNSIPESVHGISVITPPAVTEKVVTAAIDLGINHIWLQPGAESDEAIRVADEAGINLIHSGPCLLVVLGFRESAEF